MGDMDRRKKMIQKREAKQRKVENRVPLGRTETEATLSDQAKLIFKPGTAGIGNVWLPGVKDGAEKPAAPRDQP
jgi:hypothetical protein